MLSSSIVSGWWGLAGPSHLIGFGGFSSFLRAGGLAAAFFAFLSSSGRGYSLPNVILMFSPVFLSSLYGLGLNCCTSGLPGIIGRRFSSMSRTSSKSMWKLASSYAFCSRKFLNYVCFSSISNLSISSSPSLSEKSSSSLESSSASGLSPVSPAALSYAFSK